MTLQMDTGHEHDYLMEMEFLSIMLAIIFHLLPRDVDEVQIWPYASDPDSKRARLSLTFRRVGDSWCPTGATTNQNRCIILRNGRWLDENGKVLLEIKSSLKSDDGTNFVFKPADWDLPQNFTVQRDASSYRFELTDKGKIVRMFKAEFLPRQGKLPEKP